MLTLEKETVVSQSKTDYKSDNVVSACPY